MKTKLLASLLGLALLALFGCASAGTKIDQSATAKIQKGVTTKEQVVALLGAPMSDTLMGDGREMMMWSYAQTQVKGATFIPVVGLFAGGSDTKMTMFQVVLNKDKIVEDCLWSNSSFEAKMGRS
jgi:outer membrane protein assembly factor BamE (lipoprotein component of BamABCDE complex)